MAQKEWLVISDVCMVGHMGTYSIFKNINKHSVAKALSMLSLLGFFFSSSKVFVVQIIWLNQCSTIELHWFPHPKTLEKWQSSGFISKVSTLSSSPRSSFLTIRAFDRERINGVFFFFCETSNTFLKFLLATQYRKKISSRRIFLSETKGA